MRFRVSFNIWKENIQSQILQAQMHNKAESRNNKS